VGSFGGTAGSLFHANRIKDFVAVSLAVPKSPLLLQPGQRFANVSVGLALLAWCRKLANDRCHRRMNSRASFEIAHELDREGVGAGECVFH